MQALDRILGKTSHLRVLRVLHHAEPPLSGRDVQRRAGMSNRAVMLALEELIHLNLVQRETHPHRHAYRINPRHFFWEHAVRPALEAETRFWDDLRRLVRRTLRPRPVAAIVTGAIARDPPRPDAPLHLHLLYETGRDRIRSYRGLDTLRERTALRYGLGLHATFMDISNMDAPQFRTLWRLIDREGLLLYGQPPVIQVKAHPEPHAP